MRYDAEVIGESFRDRLGEPAEVRLEPAKSRTTTREMRFGVKWAPEKQDLSVEY